MKACEPERQGTLDRDGARIGFEVFGTGDPTILLLPTWTIIHSRFWKLQIPYLARHFRVVTYDGQGNGRSGRTSESAHYRVEAQAEAALAVMDATTTKRAVLVSLSQGARESLLLSADHPDRVLAQVFLGPPLPLTPQHADPAAISANFHREFDTYEGWNRYNAHYWTTHFREFAEFFFGECFVEPHSTKPREDCVRWAMETTPEVLIAEAGTPAPDRETILGWCSRVRSPVLVIHGSDDRASPPSRGRALAEATAGRHVVLQGSGHIPLARDPVRVNLLIRDFVDELVRHRRSTT
jgi:pimeloyl-ACP methyl ester carboxylesterase